MKTTASPSNGGWIPLYWGLDPPLILRSVDFSGEYEAGPTPVQVPVRYLYRRRFAWRHRLRPDVFGSKKKAQVLPRPLGARKVNGYEKSSAGT
jgi:hypothetical protein